jgi:hypothetical protein
MHDSQNSITSAKRVPWNKGKVTGAKPPLRPKHVWAIRTKLQIDHLTRDLALFNLAIDSKLRGCDLVAVMVDDVVNEIMNRAVVANRVDADAGVLELSGVTGMTAPFVPSGSFQICAAHSMGE